MQLFVTDKGFVYVIPMKSKSEVPLDFKCLQRKLEHQIRSSVTLRENKYPRKFAIFGTKWAPLFVCSKKELLGQIDMNYILNYSKKPFKRT